MDFSAIYLLCKIGADNSITVQDYILVFEYLHGNQRIRHYYDFLCDIPEENTNDYFFVQAVWLKLVEMNVFDGFDSIEIWSDGGPKHFKTRYCQYFWHQLSNKLFQQQKIQHNFFASYHGHSLADSHAGHDKQLVKSEYIKSQQERMRLFDDFTAKINYGPASAHQIADLLNQNLSHTTAIVLDNINRDPATKPKVKSLPNIKQFHSFEYQNHQCCANYLTNDENQINFRFQPE